MFLPSLALITRLYQTHLKLYKGCDCCITKLLILLAFWCALRTLVSVVSYNKLILQQPLSPPLLDGKQISCRSMGCENDQTICYTYFLRPIVEAVFEVSCPSMKLFAQNFTLLSIFIQLSEDSCIKGARFLLFYSSVLQIQQIFTWICSNGTSNVKDSL